MSSNRRNKEYVKKTRKKRRILSKGGDDRQAFKLMRAEAAILRLNSGFNTHPRKFFEHILKVKYGAEYVPVKAIDTFKVLRDTSALDADPNNSSEIARNVYKAISLDDVEYLRWYLDQGFSVNYHNEFGDTLLHYACKSLAVRCIHELIERKATVGVSTVNGRTPLHMALWHHEEISLPVIRLICQSEPCMLISTDWLDACPMDNVCPVQWPVLCDFFNLSIDHYFDALAPHTKRIARGVLDMDIISNRSGDLDWEAIKSKENETMELLEASAVKNYEADSKGRDSSSSPTNSTSSNEDNAETTGNGIKKCGEDAKKKSAIVKSKVKSTSATSKSTSSANKELQRESPLLVM
eukprot:g1562.t1